MCVRLCVYIERWDGSAQSSVQRPAAVIRPRLLRWLRPLEWPRLRSDSSEEVIYISIFNSSHSTAVSYAPLFQRDPFHYAPPALCRSRHVLTTHTLPSYCHACMFGNGRSWRLGLSYEGAERFMLLVTNYLFRWNVKIAMCRHTICFVLFQEEFFARKNAINRAWVIARPSSAAKSTTTAVVLATLLFMMTPVAFEMATERFLYKLWPLTQNYSLCNTSPSHATPSPPIRSWWYNFSAMSYNVVYPCASQTQLYHYTST